MKISYLTSLFLLSFSYLALVGQPLTIAFEEDQLESLGVGQQIPLSIRFDSPLAEGIFGYSLQIDVLAPLGEPPAILAVSVPDALDHFGVRGEAAEIMINGSTASIRGTVDFLDSEKESYRESLLATLLLESAESGNYSVTVSLRETLGPNESTFVSGSGDELDTSINFRSTILQVQGLWRFISDREFSAETGLWRQNFIFHNTTGVSIDGFKVSATRLDPDILITNADDPNDPAGPSFLYPYAVAPEVRVPILVEYFVPDLREIPDPTFVVTTLRRDQGDVVDGPSLRSIVSNDLMQFQIGPESVLLQFPTEAGKRYFVQYSDRSPDTDDFITVLPGFDGYGGPVQWLDHRSAEMEALPENGQRFYRLLVEEE